MVSIEQAGHFQFLDKQTSMQHAVCAQGRVPDYFVRQVSQVGLFNQSSQLLLDPVHKQHCTLVHFWLASSEHHMGWHWVHTVAQTSDCRTAKYMTGARRRCAMKWCVMQAVMVAWALAMVPPRSEQSSVGQQASCQQDASLLSIQTPSSIVSKVLASISDPFVELQSRTKNV